MRTNDFIRATINLNSQLSQKNATQAAEIERLKAENETCLRQRNMMRHLLGGGTFTVEELKEAGLGEGILIEQRHDVFRLKQTVTKLVEVLKWYGDRENYQYSEFDIRPPVLEDQGSKAREAGKEIGV